MSKQIFWSNTARHDYREQLSYSAERNVYNARLVEAYLDASVRSLADMPTGRPGRVFGTYEKLVAKSSLIIIYELSKDNSLVILRIIHAARNWPQET